MGFTLKLGSTGLSLEPILSEVGSLTKKDTDPHWEHTLGWSGIFFSTP